MWSLPGPDTSPISMTRLDSIARCASFLAAELANVQRGLDVPAERRRCRAQVIEHARRIVERAGDEEHKQDHELGHGDLDRTGLRRGSLAARKASRMVIVDRRTVFPASPRSGLSCPRFPSFTPTASAEVRPLL